MDIVQTSSFTITDILYVLDYSKWRDYFFIQVQYSEAFLSSQNVRQRTLAKGSVLLATDAFLAMTGGQIFLRFERIKLYFLVDGLHSAIKGIVICVHAIYSRSASAISLPVACYTELPVAAKFSALLSALFCGRKRSRREKEKGKKEEEYEQKYIKEEVKHDVERNKNKHTKQINTERE
jgi:hypothetical protein